ncbi:YcjX family protein [Ferrimonas sediminicola]|uniref:YcjX family protein n=1 Tax=Ferrimonas sediminicola TaxID=2569538 RepID=A0A4U1B9Z1_9GAMM|nr:YcjX family protein [Ferrimonas sediminicola]TKB46850.1 YcjX family protein [Ferrimonas sediminicola]
MSAIKHRVKRLTSQLEEIAQRGLDRHIRLGVTGISGAGKTAFITALVNQLLQAESHQLPAWQVMHQGRYLGGRIAPQPDLTLKPFDYSGAIVCLKAQPPSWPPSTRTISEIRLALRYLPDKGLAGQLGRPVTLYLDIIDYPGEWLLDLPLLQQAYQQWCEQIWPQLQLPAWREVTEAWCGRAQALCADATEAEIAELAGEYADLLLQLKQRCGASLLQPGRALLPGELAGAPVLAWFPLPPHRLAELPEESVLKLTLESRYQAYRDQVVAPFFRDYFAKLDRQVVLVDCLSALNQGRDQVDQLAQTLQALSHSFRYGPGSLVTRLFRPRIDRVLFAATKADHLTVDQHHNLLQLMHSLMRSSRRQPRYFGTQMETLVLSAINATRQGQVERQGRTVSVISGTSLDGDKSVRFPGEVPASLPGNEFWQAQGFNFQPFSPPDWDGRDALPHMRLDYALQFLIGDKMR